VAGVVKGTQVGLVNISDDMYGLPIGLINYTKNGIRDIGAWYDTSDYMYGFWANGTNNLYSIVYGGEAYSDWCVNSNSLSFGYGVGYRFVGKPLSVDLDLSMKQFFGPNWDRALSEFKRGEGYAGFGVEAVSSFPSARLTVGIPLMGKLEAFGGVSADIGVSGYCAVPDALRSDYAVHFRAFGSDIDVNPQLYFGVRL
jgi:hypothetical protein